VNSPQFVRQVNAGLRPVLGDDRIVAGARVLRIPPRRVLTQLSAAVYAASLLALAFVFLLARGHWHSRAALIGFVVAEAAALLLGLVRIFVQRPMLLAVTDRQLLCCRLADLRKQPARVTAAPLSRARITVYRNRPHATTPRKTTLRCLMPGSGPLILTSVKGSQDDLDRLVAVAHSAGARINLAQHDVTMAAGPQARREYPGEHRRSGGGGGDPTRS
jgi:hypothetical protein